MRSTALVVSKLGAAAEAADHPDEAPQLATRTRSLPIVKAFAKQHHAGVRRARL